MQSRDIREPRRKLLDFGQSKSPWHYSKTRIAFPLIKFMLYCHWFDDPIYFLIYKQSKGDRDCLLAELIIELDQKLEAIVKAN